jgi:hypothetical protein
MKYILTACALLTLAACSDEPAYLTNRIVKDRDGCAFTVRPNVGDTVFLRFLPDASDMQTCKFPKG